MKTPLISASSIHVSYILILALALVLNACCHSRPESPCGARLNSKRVTLKTQSKPDKPLLAIRGNAHLDGLHPELINRARMLYERASRRGIKLRFISGYRRYRKRPERAGRSVASWHNFGAAFDVILHDRKTMKDALKHLRQDRSRWDQVGGIAQELGLTWGKTWGGDKELFHFEWHPGHPDALRRPAFKRLTSVTGSQVKDYQAAWKLFKE